MTSRSIYARAAAGCLGLTLAFGAVSVGSIPASAATVETAAYSNMVLNVGGTSADRNFVWYADTDAPQQVKLYKAGEESTTTQLLDPTLSGTSLDSPELFWFHTEVSGLDEGATYVWQAGSNELGWSSSYEFTVSVVDGEFDVLAFGDTQIGSGGGKPSDGAAWQNLLDVAFNGYTPDFLLSVGDQVNTHDSSSEYTDYLEPDQLRTNALATNIGNHDDGSGSDPQHSYAEHFNMPNRTGLDGWNNDMGNYWFINEGVLFVSMNSNERDPAKHEAWLRDVVTEHGADADWKVATWHHSLYSTASHATDGDVEDRRTWMPPLMSELDFDMVLSGHDHVYNRTHLLNGGHPVGDLTAPETLAKQNGEVLYLTLQSSSGSKYYTIQEGIDFTYNAVESQTRTPVYSKMEFTSESIRVVSTDVNGVTIDDVTLTNAPADATPNPVPEGPAQTVFEGPSLIDDPIENVVDEATGEVSVEARILAADDDVEEYADTGEMYMDSSDLEIVQESPGDEDPETQNVGLRFDQVAIPAGATITSAYLQFTVDEANKTGDPFDVRIHAENTGSASKYTEDDYNVSGREYFEETVAWQDAPVWSSNGDAGEDQRTPDLTSLVQSVVNHDDWARGGAMSFMLTGTGTRTAEAYEGGSGEEAPQLMITYTLDGATEVQGLIMDDRDDVEQYVAGSKAGQMDHGSSDLELVDEKPNNPGADRQIIGLRYDGLEIPQGAEIISARVQFTTDETDKNTDPFRVEINAESADSSAPFGDADNDLSDRPLTESTAVWSDIPAWVIEHESGPNQRTVDLSSVVQEIVDREGWVSGNALSLLLSGEGQRLAESRDGEPDMAPELWIVYRVADAETPVPTTEPADTAQPTDEPIHTGAPTEAPHATTATSNDDGTLAQTGADGAELIALIAAGTLLAGAGSLLAMRARRTNA